MATTGDFFSPDYFTARARFREAAQRAGGRLDAIPLIARGPGGQELTIDIARFGDESPREVLLHSSGIHGVEGFAGSAIQLQCLQRPPEPPPKAAIVLVHALNPFGMAWLRRCNENNVDLNRNFLDASERYEGMPEGYDVVDSFLNPKDASHFGMFHAKAFWLVVRHGTRSLKQAIAAGQYERPAGLFFGGKELQEGPRRYQQFLSERFQSARRVIAIDVHTGLGKFGRDALLVEPDALDRLTKIFGDRVQPMQADRSVAYQVRGGLQTMLFRTFRNGAVDFIGQEFGTRPGLPVLHALSEENLWNRLARSSPADQRAKQALKEAFCPPSMAWREKVLSRGAEVIKQAIDAL